MRLFWLVAIITALPLTTLAQTAPPAMPNACGSFFQSEWE
jgi:hypothetical protein